MTYHKLYYNSVRFKGIDKDFGPNFICPRCKRVFKDDCKGVVTPINKTTKFNKQVSFKCPYCGAEIRLYVAVTKLSTGEENICISVNPIRPNFLDVVGADRLHLEEDIAARIE